MTTRINSSLNWNKNEPLYLRSFQSSQISLGNLQQSCPPAPRPPSPVPPPSQTPTPATLPPSPSSPAPPPLKPAPHPSTTPPPPTSISTQSVTISPTQPSPLMPPPTHPKIPSQPPLSPHAALSLPSLPPPKDHNPKTNVQNIQNPPKSTFQKDRHHHWRHNHQHHWQISQEECSHINPPPKNVLTLNPPARSPHHIPKSSTTFKKITKPLPSPKTPTIGALGTHTAPPSERSYHNLVVLKFGLNAPQRNKNI